MEMVVQISALCVMAALLCVVVKKGTPEIALVLTVAAVTAGLLALSTPFAALAELLEMLQRECGISEEWFLPLYKTLGIALVVRLGSDLCRDAGAEALSGVVETAGTVCALVVAAPLMETVVELILEMRP